MKFRLSDETKNILSNSKPTGLLTKSRTKYYNSKEFYNRHPDLAPRDIYLYEGRIITHEQINKTLKKDKIYFAIENFIEKIKNYINVNRLFGKK